MTNVVWYAVVRLPLEQDLSPFLSYLNTVQIRYHVTEEDGQQQLWISDESRRLEVANKLTQWLSGDTEYHENMPTAKQPSEAGINLFQVILRLLYIVPVTFITILLGFIGSLLVFADQQSLSYAFPFLFQAISNNGSFLSLGETLARGEFWRLLTPIFLHFSPLHIIFNSLVLWEFGRRIEMARGSRHIGITIVIIGVCSNIAQYMVQANTYFGGLSGVVYGVIGYIAVYQQYIQHPILQFNKVAIAFFIVWLLLGVFGIIDIFISGSIANAAHVAGLITGAIIGFTEVSRDKTNMNETNRK